MISDTSPPFHDSDDNSALSTKKSLTTPESDDSRNSFGGQPGAANLIMVVSEIGGPSHLMEYEFVDGKLASTDEVMSTYDTQLAIDFSEGQLYNGRYLITQYGGIVDITIGQLLSSRGRGPDYALLLGIEDNCVIIRTGQTQEYYCYDLAQQQCYELESPGKWSLPGVLSPDGTMSVSSDGWDGGKIWLYDVNGNKREIATGFYIRYSGLASTIRGVPLMWLDNQRVLTQKSNGEIVIVKIDGSIESVVTIDLSQIDSAPSGLAGALSASLSRDFDGNIIYTISLLGPDGKFRSNRFVIDVENTSYSECDPEWTALGHGFEYALQGEMAVIRHNGQEIGQERFLRPAEVRTFNDYIAIVSYESSVWTSDYANPTSIKVWSSANEGWTTISFESPKYIYHHPLTGWLEAN